MYKVVIYLTPTNIALFLLFASAAFNCLAKYFYSNYRLVFGTLYPAYSSYKAIKRKDVREYTRWMMYWVCFGIFSATEFFTDIFLAFWFPFYYELKILFILWLMSPYGNGAKIFYKSIVHPELDKREEIIDSYINQATLLGFASLNHLWRRFSASFNNALAYGLQIAYSALTHRVQSSDVTDSAYSNTFFASILSRRSDANLRLFDDQTLTTRPRAVETYQQQPQSSSTPEPITIEEADLSEDDDYQPKQSLTRSSSNSSMETIPATASTRHHKGRLNGSSFDEESTASAFSLDESNEHEYVPEVGKKQRKTKVQPTTPTVISSEVSSRPKRAAADRARGRFRELKD